MTVTVTVTAGLVDDLRNGLYFALDDIAGELFAAGEGVKRDPEAYADRFERLDLVRGLLDLTGWSRVDVPTQVDVDLGEYGAVLQGAVARWISVERDRFHEIDRVDAERARRGEPPSREVVAARLDALEILLVTVDGRLGSLA